MTTETKSQFPSNSNRSGTVSPSASVICHEIFDETCQPSSEEINDYASLLGIDLVKETYLVHLAKEGLMQALPNNWKICYSEEKNGHYYYNIKTKKSQWDHPLDAVYRNFVKEARENQKQKQEATVVISIKNNSDVNLAVESDIYNSTNNENCLNLTNRDRNGKVKSTSSSVFDGDTNSSFENTTFGRSSKFRSDNFNYTLNDKTYTRTISQKFEFNSTNETFVNQNSNDFGSGAMLLKSHRKSDKGQSHAGNSAFNNSCPKSNFPKENIIETISNVKSILRDSSQIDMGRRETLDEADINTEDRKIVRFNLNEQKLQISPEDDASSSRRLTSSREESINSDDEAEDDNLWDDDNDVVEENNVETLTNNDNNKNLASSSKLNPISVEKEKFVKEIEIVPLKQSQTIQMLQAQNFSIDEQGQVKLTDLIHLQTNNLNCNAVEYLDEPTNNVSFQTLDEETDSESKNSSIRSFVINKSGDVSLNMEYYLNNDFDLDELDRKHSGDVEQLKMKMQSVGEAINLKNETPSLSSFKMTSKLVGFLKRGTTKGIVDASVDPLMEHEELYQKLEKGKQTFLRTEYEYLERYLQNRVKTVRNEHELKFKNIQHEYDLRLTSHQHQLDEAFEIQLETFRAKLEKDLDIKRKSVVNEHKAHMATLQRNHNEIVQDMERDLKSEREILKKEHLTKLTEIRNQLSHELDLERQRMRDSSEDCLYEKIRCEKRLLEDKYRCLKEKYARLKTDVKLSLERRNRRREIQAQHQQSSHVKSGSGTERSISIKSPICNNENRTLNSSLSKGIETIKKTNKDIHQEHSLPIDNQQENNLISDKGINTPKRQRCSSTDPKHITNSDYIKQTQDDTNSISQSDTTNSNNYIKDQLLSATFAIANDNSDSEVCLLSQEKNNNFHENANRKKIFSRMKSASTSRLTSENSKIDRPNTPVENLRHQLKKLEDLEDQLPVNTLGSIYHLRYPFSDISNENAGLSSELEFFKHRIHLERDSVRRAKESLRTQRSNFRSRQREIKQKHKASVGRHNFDQLMQEERELTEMEVNLHRTRALLGEKVIRLRHLEQSLLRIYDKEKPHIKLHSIDLKEDATLSDLSSHSSSGFSSTDFASGADSQNITRRKDLLQQESNDCIQNLEILHAEIHEILGILGKNHLSTESTSTIPSASKNQARALNIEDNLVTPVQHHNRKSQMLPLNTVSSSPVHSFLSQSSHTHFTQPRPTLSNRLETYRQIASGRMQSSMTNAILATNTIVSHSPHAVNYTSSLLERTRDLRNWLRQAKSDNEIFSISPSSTKLDGDGSDSSIATVTIDDK